MQPSPTSADDSPRKRVILVANRTCPCPALPAQVLDHLGTGDGEVLVLAPALNSRLRHWLSDVDGAVRVAEERMHGTIEELRRHGLTVNGEVGDANPITAIADALRHFEASHIIISTWPASASNWLEKDLPRLAGERFQLPIKHLVSAYDAPAPAMPVV
jgi:hypothetical protein